MIVAIGKNIINHIISDNVKIIRKLSPCILFVSEKEQNDISISSNGINTSVFCGFKSKYNLDVYSDYCEKDLSIPENLISFYDNYKTINNTENDGQYLQINILQNTNDIIVNFRVDFSGQETAYYIFKDQCIFITENLAEFFNCCRFTKLISKTAVCTELVSGSVCYDSTLYKDIYKIRPRYLYSYKIQNNKSKLNIKYDVEMQKVGKEKSKLIVPEIAIRNAVIVSLLNMLPKQGDTVMQLSGGLDSTTLFSLALYINKTLGRKDKIIPISYVTNSIMNDCYYIGKCEQYFNTKAYKINIEDYNYNNDGIFTFPSDNLYWKITEYTHMNKYFGNNNATIIGGQGGDAVLNDNNCFWHDSKSFFGLLLSFYRYAYNNDISIFEVLQVNSLFRVNINKELEKYKRNYIGEISGGIRIGAIEEAYRSIIKEFDFLKHSTKNIEQFNEINVLRDYLYLNSNDIYKTLSPYIMKNVVATSKKYLQLVPPLKGHSYRAKMKRIFINFLPDDIINRESKGGIGISVKKVLKEKKSEINNMFYSSILERNGIINSEKLISEINDYLNNKTVNARYLIRIISMEKWLKEGKYEICS